MRLVILDSGELPLGQAVLQIKRVEGVSLSKDRYVLLGWVLDINPLKPA